MTNCNCCNRCYCALAAGIAGVVLGVIAAFLQITGAITVTTAFLWVALGIATGFLGVLLLGLCCRRCDLDCQCRHADITLGGILLTALVSVILLAVGITATSVLSAVLVGLLVLGLTLIYAGSACYVRAAIGCGN